MDEDLDDLYDEFGNYIGPECEDGDDNLDFDGDAVGLEDDVTGIEGQLVEMDTDAADGAIVLNEDRKYYIDAEEAYPGVTTAVLDEDAMDPDEPIIKPVVTRETLSAEKIQESNSRSDFMLELMSTTSLMRNVTVCGHLHHGKTFLMDLLIEASRGGVGDLNKNPRYTDTRIDEQKRELSIKAEPVSLLLEDLNKKSFVLNMVDCPGHSNFVDEACVSFHGCDGALIVIDALEGVMMMTEIHIREALDTGLSLCVVINKIDRLILELKLPPQDAYFKLQNILEEVNDVISSHSSSKFTMSDKTERTVISPANGNVCFSSGLHRWTFSLASFANQYAERHKGLDPGLLRPRLWGDWYFDSSTNSFTKKRPSSGGKRTFVEFILEPLYKLYSMAVGDEPKTIVTKLKKKGIKLTMQEASSNTGFLLRTILTRFYRFRGLATS